MEWFSATVNSKRGGCPAEGVRRAVHLLGKVEHLFAAIGQRFLETNGDVSLATEPSRTSSFQCFFILLIDRSVTEEPNRRSAPVQSREAFVLSDGFHQHPEDVLSTVSRSMGEGSDKDISVTFARIGRILLLMIRTRR